MENPYVVPGSPMDLALFWSNIGFTAIFTLEAAAKAFAFTFRAYIRNITNMVRRCGAVQGARCAYGGATVRTSSLPSWRTLLSPRSLLPSLPSPPRPDHDRTRLTL